MQIVLVTPMQFSRLWHIIQPQHRIQVDGIPGSLSLQPHGVNVVVLSDDFGGTKVLRYPREAETGLESEITLGALIEQIIKKEFQDA
jgi:hypothetical protein